MSNAAFYYTNCYRTKVFKMRGAGEKMEKGTKKQREILSKMMKEFQRYADDYAEVEEKKINFSEDFKDRHRELWTQNGDRISLIYSGTTSVASYITKG